MAVHFSWINPRQPVGYAAARPVAARQPSQRASTAPSETALSLATASPASSTAKVSTGTASGATTAATTTPASNSLFPMNAPMVQATPADSGPPTAQSVFGPTPWLTNPTGSGPTGTYTYNPYYFASPQTAAAVASMVGGQVVQMNSLSGGSRFVQDQPNQMVRLANGALINPGLVASFYTHGYPQSMVDQMIANEVANVTAGT
jgi:hypothetical protein